MFIAVIFLCIINLLEAYSGSVSISVDSIYICDSKVATPDPFVYISDQINSNLLLTTAYTINSNNPVIYHNQSLIINHYPARLNFSIVDYNNEFIRRADEEICWTAITILTDGNYHLTCNSTLHNCMSYVNISAMVNYTSTTMYTSTTIDHVETTVINDVITTNSNVAQQNVNKKEKDNYLWLFLLIIIAIGLFIILMICIIVYKCYKLKHNDREDTQSKSTAFIDDNINNNNNNNRPSTTTQNDTISPKDDSTNTKTTINRNSVLSSTNLSPKTKTSVTNEQNNGANHQPVEQGVDIV